MTAIIGTFALGLALAVALYGCVASFAAARKRNPVLVESARTCAFSLLALVVAANGAMLAAILSNDFTVRYVAENSSRSTPTFFKVLSLWSADEGSLLLWNLILAGYIAAVALRFRKRRPETFPWALGTMFGVSVFYLILVLGPTTPFATLATAFLHSVMVEERRGMLKVWNLSLVIGTFALTVFGTFLTRGSILASVHTFAQSAVGPMYLGFLLLVLTGGFGLIALRSRVLSSDNVFDRAVSREAVFLGNNLLLAALAFTVLIGTIFPLLDQPLTGARVSVGGPYFDRTAIPVTLLLVFLMGIGPLLPWRAGSTAQLASRLRAPAWAGALTAAGLALAGGGHVVA